MRMVMRPGHGPSGILLAILLSALMMGLGAVPVGAAAGAVPVGAVPAARAPLAATAQARSVAQTRPAGQAPIIATATAPATTPTSLSTPVTRATPAPPSTPAPQATPPNTDGYAPGIGEGPATGGGTATIWANSGFAEIAASEGTAAALTAEGRLYMWGQPTGTGLGGSQLPVPVEIELAANTTAVDVAVFQNQAVLLDSDGQLQFVHLEREVEGSGTLAGNLTPQHSLRGTGDANIKDCEQPYLGFVGNLVQDRNGALCELWPEADNALSDSSMPTLDGVAVTAVVMFDNSRPAEKGAVALTDEGTILHLTPGADSQGSWHQDALAPQTRWKAIVPDPQQTGVYAVAEDGTLHDVDATSGISTPVDVPATFESGWFTEQRKQEAGYLQTTEGELYLVAPATSGSEARFEKFDMGESVLAGDSIAELAIGTDAIALSESGEIFSWGTSGWMNGNTDRAWNLRMVPSPVGLTSADRLSVDGVDVPIEVDDDGVVTFEAPPHSPGTVPISVWAYGSFVPIADYTYYLPVEAAAADIKAVGKDKASGKQLVEADVTLTVPKNMRDKLGTDPLYAVVSEPSIRLMAASEQSPLGGSIKVSFNANGEAHIPVQIVEGQEISVVVVGESTPRDSVDVEALGTAVDISTRAANTVLYVVLAVVAGAVAGVVAIVWRSRRAKRVTAGGEGPGPISTN